MAGTQPSQPSAGGWLHWLEGSQNGACLQGGVARILQLQPSLARMAVKQGAQPSKVHISRLAVSSPRFDRVALKARRKNLAVCATLLRVVLCARRAVAARRSREEWVAYSFDRFIAAIKTRYTPHTRRHVLSHPTTGKTLS